MADRYLKKNQQQMAIITQTSFFFVKLLTT